MNMNRKCILLGWLTVLVTFIGCGQGQAISSTLTPETISTEQPAQDINSRTPIPYATALALHQALLYPGEELRGVGVNLETVIEEEDTRFSILGSRKTLEYVDPAGSVIQSRWQINLDIGDTQRLCVSDVYAGDLIECRDYRVRVVTILEENDEALVAWSRFDTPLVPLSQDQITAAYDVLRPYDVNETGLVLLPGTEIIYEDSLSLISSQPESEEVTDGYITDGFHKRLRFYLEIAYSDNQFERVVYAGDTLEFDNYRIHIHYVDSNFVYLSISSQNIAN